MGDGWVWFEGGEGEERGEKLARFAVDERKKRERYGDGKLRIRD
jgi:hypothetical protein